MFKNKSSSIELLLVLSVVFIIVSSIIKTSEVLADQYSGKNTSNNKSLPIEPEIKQDPKLASQLPLLGNTGDNSFKTVDNNHDGKITFQEFQDNKGLRKQEKEKRDADQIIKRCDKDKNGEISLSELSTADDMRELTKSSDLSSHCMLPKEILELMDLNEDGLLTPEEVNKGVSSNHQISKKTKKKLQGKIISRDAARRKKEFVSCDINLDEILTLREVMSKNCSLHFYTEQFDAYDSDSDRILSTIIITYSVDAAS